MNGSPYTDLERPPLDAAWVRRGLLVQGSPWRELRVVEEVHSTNAVLAAEARAGAEGGLVLVAEHQSSGRGRLDRTWSSPPRAGLTLSMLIRQVPAFPVGGWTWLPLILGLAACEVISALGRIDAVLKWPNDVLIGGHRRKAAGILAESVYGAGGGGAVIGIGLNVTTRAEELGTPQASSLLLEQSECTDRNVLLLALLRSFGEHWRRWREAGGDVELTGQRAAYLQVCDTLGRVVRVELPENRSFTGAATAIDADGRLQVQTPEGQRTVAAGDVVHVRPGKPDGGSSGGSSGG